MFRWDIKLKGIRLWFAIALIFYAVFSSPTPDRLGWTEICIVFFLLLTLRPDFFKGHFSRILLLAYGLSVPVIEALLHGYDFVNILRDLVPFAFLLMPLFYSDHYNLTPKFLSASLVGIGLIFSLRSLISFGAEAFMPDQWLGPPPDLLYLANSPEVLFSCMALLCLGFSPTKMKVSQRVICVMLALLPFLAMTALMQRASLLYIAVAAGLFFVLNFWQAPRRLMPLLIIVILACVATTPFLNEIYKELSLKTQLVGLNSRSEEWKTVLEHVSVSPTSFLFGLGWGAGFENPAVGGLKVNFTHSLLSSLLLKTGITGLGIFLIYFFQLLKRAIPFVITNKIYLFVITGPLFIGFSLYASYKSLGYGLLLLLIASMAEVKKLEPPQSLVQ